MFENIIQQLGEVLKDKISIPIVVGGWAVNYLGYTRNTLDFDIMIFEDDFSLIEKQLAKIGYQKAIQTELYARFFVKNNDQIPYIDCLFADKQTYDKICLKGKKIDIFGMKYILPKVEHIIAMKLHALYYGREYRLGKDFGDIVTLIEIHNMGVSEESEFYLLCEKYADKKIYREIKNAVIGK
ncbi:MAG: hypothetical protein U9O87_05015 [Verrucomicrobiota bacterium]|nr:hypothetical protein [Verrucomicrobiota bacterium]